MSWRRTAERRSRMSHFPGVSQARRISAASSGNISGSFRPRSSRRNARRVPAFVTASLSDRRRTAADPSSSPSLRELDRRLVERMQIGDQVLDPLLVLDPGEDHFGAGDLGLRVLDVCRERRIVPSDTRVLVRIRIDVAFNRARFASEQAVEHRTNSIFRVIASLMTCLAYDKHLFYGSEKATITEAEFRTAPAPSMRWTRSTSMCGNNRIRMSCRSSRVYQQP